MADAIILDHHNLKLGKGPAKVDPHALKLERFLATLPPPPQSINWLRGLAQFGMMLNGANSYGSGVPGSGLGDCVPAAIAHGEQVVTINSPAGELTPADLLVLNLYINVGGYVLGQPSTDQGAVIVDALNYVKLHGMGHKTIPGHHRKFPLLGYADVDQFNLTHMMQSVAIFGVNNIGLQLPVTAQSQIGGVWDVVGDPTTDPDSQPGSWGGHSAILAAYETDTTGLIWTLITWGQIQLMTNKFLTTYCDEAHVLFFAAWLEQFGDRFPDMKAQLLAEMSQLSGG